MPDAVNFFTGHCADGSPSDDVTDAVEFGLCDDLHEAGIPKKRAYLDTTNSDKWIAKVINTPAFQVTFKGVDACIVIMRPTVPDEPAEREKSCDGILLYEDGIVFVELKERNHQWLEDGIKQLEKTISTFKESHSIDTFNRRRAYVANSKRPVFQKGHQRFIDSFTNDTGVILYVEAKIDLKPLAIVDNDA